MFFGENFSSCIPCSVAIWLSLTHCDSNFKACYLEHMSTGMCDMVLKSCE